MPRDNDGSSASVAAMRPSRAYLHMKLKTEAHQHDFATSSSCSVATGPGQAYLYRVGIPRYLYQWTPIEVVCEERHIECCRHEHQVQVWLAGQQVSQHDQQEVCKLVTLVDLVHNNVRDAL